MTAQQKKDIEEALDNVETAFRLARQGTVAPAHLAEAREALKAALGRAGLAGMPSKVVVS